MLEQLFGAVCGQNPAHTWVLGGIPLPCCQRCTGLYAGACVAACLHWWLRPRLTGRLLEIHGAFLLLMLPFGYHWLPQGPELRTMTGVLFGFGVVTFLWLPLASEERSRSRPPAYFLALAGTLVLTPLIGAKGGLLMAYTLAALVCVGALALAALTVANTIVGATSLLRWLRRLGPARTRV